MLIQSTLRAPSHWKALITAWASVLDDYEREGQPKSRSEVGYWNTERANVGFLLAAAYRSGGIGISEYTQRTTARELAQVDIWVKVNGESFVCEAKQKFVKHPSGLETCVCRMLEVAEYEVTDLEDDGSFHKRAAIAFAIPFGVDPMQDWQDKWDAVYPKLNIVASAIYETNQNPPPTCTHPHPGIIIAVREI